MTNPLILDTLAKLNTWHNVNFGSDLPDDIPMTLESQSKHCWDLYNICNA